MIEAKTRTRKQQNNELTNQRSRSDRFIDAPEKEQTREAQRKEQYLEMQQEDINTQLEAAKAEYDQYKEAISEIAEKFGASVLDVTSESFILELSSTPQKIDDFLEAVEGLSLIEMCRSGAIAMDRGSVDYDI